MTQDELREAVLAALLDYETLKKARRLKTVKKALRGTMIATVIGSSGVMAANQGRNNQVKDIVAITANADATMSTTALLLQAANQPKLVPGVAHFAVNRHTLVPVQEERLRKLAMQLPKHSEISIIGRTDSSGGQSYNNKLGKKRAQAVASYLESQGFTIKAVESEISNRMPESWMERRVDIIVGSAPKPFFLNLTQLEKQSSPQQLQSQAEPKAPENTYDLGSKVTSETENRTIIRRTKNTEAKMYAVDGIAKAKPEQLKLQRQKVRGVTHFAVNNHTLALAHQERLMELVKQLPKDAELTVIGRTESHGAEDQNKNLGLQRAKTVALFLGYHGVKIKAVGSKASSDGFTGWGARRVDIVVDSDLTPLKINLQPLLVQKPSLTQKHIQHAGTSPKIDGKKAVAIEKDITRAIERARNIYNLP